MFAFSVLLSVSGNDAAFRNLFDSDKPFLGKILILLIPVGCAIYVIYKRFKP
jgi:hypothetical protein